MLRYVFRRLLTAIPTLFVIVTVAFFLIRVALYFMIWLGSTYLMNWFSAQRDRSDDPELARCEIANFRYRILHMAARVTRSARVTHLRLDRTWNWAKQLALAFARLRAAFA